MEPLSEDLVEETLHEIDLYSDDHIAGEIAKLGKKQPNLLSFIVDFTEDLDDDVVELGIYLFFTVYHMFQKGYGKKIKQVGIDEIITCFEENQKLMESMEFAHSKFYERIAEVQISPQPYIIMFVVDALLEAPEDDDAAELTDDDVGYLFLLLKTVIDILNKKTN